MLPEKKTCEFVEVTELIPASWTNWFWSLISDSAPFSWGDNNRTLVTADRLRRHIVDRLDGYDASDFEFESEEDAERYEEEKLTLLETLEEMEDTYIDLEN